MQIGNEEPCKPADMDAEEYTRSIDRGRLDNDDGLTDAVTDR